MSSVWLVMSDSSPLSEEGFHVTQEDARQRAAELACTSVEGRPVTCSIVEVADTEYEIYRDGRVPDAVWVLVEDGEVDADFGYRVTKASARDLLDARDVAAFENWETSPEREQGMRLAEYLRDRWSPSEIVRITRRDLRDGTEQPSVAAVRAKHLIRHDTVLSEPTTSVRGGLTTYTWEHADDVVVEVRINGERWESTVVHKPNARPMVWDHADDIIHAARGQLGVETRVDMRLYAGPEWDLLLNLDQAL